MEAMMVDPGLPLVMREKADADNGAEFSPCGRYRYRLWRRWAPGPLFVWVLANPSVAGVETDDPTSRKVKGFTQRWGGGAFEIVNLRAWVATFPVDLVDAFRRGEDTIGPDNPAAIRRAVARADKVVVAWGSCGRLDGLDLTVTLAGHPLHGVELYALGLNADGTPKHPARPGYTSAPIRYSLEPDDELTR